MTLRRRVSIGAVAGGVLALGAPPVNFWPAVFVMLGLLTYAWRGASPRHALLAGWAAGGTATLAAFPWIIGTVTRFTPLPTPVAVLAWIALSALGGVALALAGYLSSSLARDVGLPLAMAVSVLVCERYAPAIFPWQLAAPLIAARWLPQCADLVGLSGLGATLAGLVATITLAALDASARRRATPSLRAAPWALLTLAAMTAYGAVRERAIARVIESAPTIAVALLQPATPPTLRWDPSEFEPIAQSLRVQIFEAMRNEARLVVMSEAAFPYALPYAPGRDGTGAVPVVTWTTRADTLVGAMAVDDRDHRYNAAFLRYADGTLSAPVAKRMLVPFGEYLPVLGEFDWMRRAFPRVIGVSPGTSPPVLTLRDGTRLGVLNCFEDTMAHACVNLADTNVLVNITNDSWFGRGAAAWQHLMLARWRAIELRRDLLRAVNTGITCRIDALGRLTALLPPWQHATLHVEARRMHVRTLAPYVIRFGPLAALVFAVAVLLSARWRTR